MKKSWEDSIRKHEQKFNGDSFYISVKNIKKDILTKTILADIAIINKETRKRKVYKKRKYDISFLKNIK